MIPSGCRHHSGTGKMVAHPSRSTAGKADCFCGDRKSAVMLAPYTVTPNWPGSHQAMQQMPESHGGRIDGEHASIVRKLAIAMQAGFGIHPLLGTMISMNPARLVQSAKLVL